MIRKNHIRKYLSGYLSTYYSSLDFSYDRNKGSYQQYKIEGALRYLGKSFSGRNMTWLAAFFNIGEAVIGTIIVTVRFCWLFLWLLFLSKRTFSNRTFFMCNTIAAYRAKHILSAIRPQEVTTLKIPFIKNSFHENQISILESIATPDLYNAYREALITIWFMYGKYRRRDAAFRSYSCFEFYLTCYFVMHNEEQNTFVYYDTYSRWAYLFSSADSSVFIQHGKLTDQLHLIKMKAPQKAFYLNRSQREIVDEVLFSTRPTEYSFRPVLAFSHNELLLHNGKKNVLLVCWGNKISTEWEIVKMLAGKCNLFIKPHPGERDNSDYKRMVKEYGCIMIPKDGYPEVDVVLSYDSTLADEYEDVGIKVIRYDLLDKLEKLQRLI